MLEESLSRSSESATLDFKSAFDAASPRDWLELIKDIAAFANSGGGVILVGLNDEGVPSGFDVTPLLAVDPADIGNKIHKYTEQHLQVEFQEAVKAGQKICAIIIPGVRVPIVFTRVGETELPDGKKKTSFALGAVYFRHGAKSEPGVTEDLRLFLERELERNRSAWLTGIAQVMSAPEGSRIIVVHSNSGENSQQNLPIHLTTDKNAPSFFAVPLDETHPYRQKDLLAVINSRLGGKQINAHDIKCMRRVYSIDKDPNRCYTQSYASPRYSLELATWIVQQHEDNPHFFEEARASFERLSKMPGI